MRPDTPPETPSDPEQLLRRSLRHKAEPVKARTPLADVAFVRARTIRLRRRITTAVACVAVLVAGVPLGVDLLGDNGPVATRVQPAGSPSDGAGETRFPPPDEPAEHTVTIDDLAALPQAPDMPPTVSWYENGVINQLSQGGEQPDLEVPVPGLPEDALVSYLPVAGGWLVEGKSSKDMKPDDIKVVLIDDEGGLIRSLPTTVLPAVSADGERLAWLEKADGDGFRLVLADREGSELARQHVPQAGSAPMATYPVGFLGDLVVVESSPNEGADVWDPEAGTFSALPAWGSDDSEHAVEATDGTGLFASTINRLQGSTTFACSGVFDQRQEGKELWSTCDGLQIHALSSDEGLLGQEGRLAYGTRPAESGTSHMVVNAETGERILEVRGLDAARPVMVAESGSTVLIDASLDGQSAIIRCSLDGGCELATELRREAEPRTGTAVTLAGPH